jgi:hypothetical protein
MGVRHCCSAPRHRVVPHGFRAALAPDEACVCSRDSNPAIGLRMSGCPESADLPWELLYDTDDDWFLALSDRTPTD